jgi:predicted N-acetyltransferase YhbS
VIVRRRATTTGPRSSTSTAAPSLLEGDPAYYRRFGFVRADELGLLPPPQALYDWAFQVAVLDEDAPLPQGRVVYPPTFPG